MHHDLDIGTIPRETNLCLCAHQLRVPRLHYCFFPKTASIIGTFLVATTTSITGNASLGVLSIAILLAVALVFLLLQKDPTQA